MRRRVFECPDDDKSETNNEIDRNFDGLDVKSNNRQRLRGLRNPEQH